VRINHTMYIVLTFDMANNPLNPWLERNKNADLVEVISLYKTV